MGWYNAAGTAEAVAARAVVTTALLAIVVVAMVVFSVRGSQLEEARAYTTRLVQRTRIGVWNLPAVRLSHFSLGTLSEHMFLRDSV